ncbi:hypothetical protein FQN50_001964 [Emmonsiellopsis sp. PD_5]|nr:hypothetical protein FQN50_001964 [Emmonsiellopsis sp. PD_5]
MAIFLLLPLFIHTAGIYAQTVSIDQQQGYGDLRECAEDCFAAGISPAWSISKELDCDPHDPIDKCFCRADLQSQAERYVSSCVSASCSNTLDVSSAVSIYTAYCTSAGYTKPKETQVSTTADSNLPSKTDVPNATETANPNSPSNPGDSSPSRTSPGGQQETQTAPATPPDDNKDSGGKKLDAGEIVGIVVGVCSLLVAVVTLIINWKTLKTSLANRRNKPSSVPVAYPVQMYPVQHDRRW